MSGFRARAVNPAGNLTASKQRALAADWPSERTICWKFVFYMLPSFILLVVFFFNFPAWAETSRSGFEAQDVTTALRQVFGYSDFLPTDKIKILAGNPGMTSPISQGFEGRTGHVTLFFDLHGPRKIALLMEPLRVPRDASAPLLAIYQLSNRSNALMVPLRFPYYETRLTVVVEAEGKLWGAQETFRANLNTGSAAGRSPCDDKPREKLARFTGPLLDNMASVFYSIKADIPLISVSLQQEMSWEPVLDRNCILSQPRAIRSVQLTYDGIDIADAEWGPGIAQPSIIVSIPAAQVGAPLTLRWQDTRGHHYTYASTVPEKFQSATTPLHAASLDGDLKTVQRLLATGADVNATLPNGWTALGFAVLKNHADIVALLLEHGADPNIRFQYSDTALMWAAYMGHAELFKMLLAQGADATARDTFGNNLFALAVQGARGPMVRGMPQRNIIPIVQTLAARGLVDRSEATLNALQVAADQDNYGAIKALIEGGFDPAINAGDTPLLVWAVKHGYTELVAEMLAKGAPVNVESKQCETPLLAAVSRSYAYKGDYEYRLERERTAMVKLLLQHGAKPLAKNKRGVDAFKAAESIEVYQKDEILNLLTRASVQGGESSQPP